MGIIGAFGAFIKFEVTNCDFKLDITNCDFIMVSQTVIPNNKI